MLFYPVARPDVTPSGAEDAGLSLLGQAGMVAVRVADLASPAGPGLGRDGRSALVVAGAGRIRSGDPVVFLKPVAVAPAVVRRDGRVQAAGHPADHARLGVAEERIDALAGRRDVIGQIAAGVTLRGKVKGVARRAMTPALAIRFTLLMTLMPSDADYAEVMAALMGDLAAVPWQRPYTLPTATVACTWREALGPGPLEQLRDLAERMKSEPVLGAPDTVRDWLRLYCANLEHEVFLILHLNTRNCLIEAQELFRGTLTQTSVYPREVVKEVLRRNAAAVVIAHNHVSGTPEPSRADELITQSLRQALAVIDVKVLDHFIVAGTNTLSFAEKGLI